MISLKVILKPQPCGFLFLVSRVPVSDNQTGVIVTIDKEMVIQGQGFPSVLQLGRSKDSN